MVLRTAKRGPKAGSEFYGCSTFPACRGILPFPLVGGDEAEVSRSDQADVESDADVDVGVAGGSAEREYARRVARRKERVKDRFGRRIGGVILALTDDPQSTRAWARGAEGERALAQALERIDGIRVLHDRRAQGTRGNIDHLVVSRAGVFVVDAKLYKGVIKIRDVGGFFKRDERLFVGSRDCSRLAAGMQWQVEAVSRALASFDPVPPVTPVLCFVRGEWPLLRPPDAFQGVRLEGTRSIRKLLQGGDMLDDWRVEAITRLLAATLPPNPAI